MAATSPFQFRPGDTYVITWFQFSNEGTDTPEYIDLTLTDGQKRRVLLGSDGYWIEEKEGYACFRGTLQALPSDNELPLGLPLAITHIVHGYVRWGQNGGALTIEARILP